ncbi:MAG: disulfide bond formation protein B [Actinobacteria bacterium]|uniref:Unannotated protein n=1 Tax=freshwater metagenome TaxID=449393 RepID=A0A6J7C3L7_9ZZZZ|nr:disulfide bond formation protein B [Actinomycetota bacterium]
MPIVRHNGGMSPNDPQDFLAVLALVAAGGVVLMLAAKVIPSVASVRFLDVLHRWQLWLAALVATTASLGSIWFSEYGNHWVPCRFCWFQRIFMYSLAIILIIAAIRKDRSVKWYVVPLASIGLVFSFWHNLIEHRVIEESKLCISVTSCANPWHVSFGKLGFNRDGVFEWSGMPMTLAVMAFCGFAAILALLLTPEALDTPDQASAPEAVKEEHNGEPAAG